MFLEEDNDLNFILIKHLKKYSELNITNNLYDMIRVFIDEYNAYFNSTEKPEKEFETVIKDKLIELRVALLKYKDEINPIIQPDEEKTIQKLLEDIHKVLSNHKR